MCGRDWSSDVCSSDLRKENEDIYLHLVIFIDILNRTVDYTLDMVHSNGLTGAANLKIPQFITKSMQIRA